MKEDSINRTKKTINDGNEEIISDIATKSKNVIQIKDDHYAVIYTGKGDFLTILKRDLDDFILDHTWGFYGGDFANTKITTSKLLSTCEKYNLDLEAFGVSLEDINDLGKQKTVSIHRYVMGFYNAEKREEIKERFKGVLLEYGLESIDELVVDHDMYDSRQGQQRVYNYSDKMRIVPPKVNSQLKLGTIERHHQSIYPITQNVLTGQFQLEIKEVPSPLARTVATITDTDVLGLNIQRIQNEALRRQKGYVVRLLKYSANNENMSSLEKLPYRRQLEAEFLDELLKMIHEVKDELSDKVMIELH